MLNYSWKAKEKSLSYVLQKKKLEKLDAANELLSTAMAVKYLCNNQYNKIPPTRMNPITDYELSALTHFHIRKLLFLCNKQGSLLEAVNNLNLPPIKSCALKCNEEILELLEELRQVELTWYTVSYRYKHKLFFRRVFSADKLYNLAIDNSCLIVIFDTFTGYFYAHNIVSFNLHIY